MNKNCEKIKIYLQSHIKTPIYPMHPVILHTDRLILRPWKEEDLEPFAALNADPRVMEFFPSTLSFEESRQLYDRFAKHITENGWGLWATELKATGQFIGFIGILPVRFEAHFTPAVEVGWRLAHHFWGNGYAPEGAKAALTYGLNTLKLDEIVSFTTTINQRSQKVMQKIGMTHDANEDFNHPHLPQEHPLSRHVLYKVRKR